jgi:hypothetical protein
LIIGFYAMILIVGFFKGRYHIYWWDSANRMYIHILPIMLFYFTILFSSKIKLSKQEEHHLKIDN